MTLHYSPCRNDLLKEGACLNRFTVAAAAFSPFLKKALSSKLIRRGGLELGFWMALGESAVLTDLHCSSKKIIIVLLSSIKILSGVEWVA